MGRFIDKAQKGYESDELDDALKAANVGYFLDEKLLGAEDAIIQSIQDAELLPVSSKSSFIEYLRELLAKLEGLVVEYGEDFGNLQGTIETILNIDKVLQPLLARCDETERTLYESLYRDVFLAGRLIERYNTAVMLDETVEKAVLREALSIKQRSVGKSSRHDKKSKLQEIARNTIEQYPLVSRRRLAEKLHQYCARNRWIAPEGANTMSEWIAEVDPREKGFPTRKIDFELIV